VPTDDDIPGLLITEGWKQGTVLRVHGIELWCAETDVAHEANRFVVRGRPTPSDGRFVVASQTCDIAARLEAEPVIEALACAPEPDRSKRASYRTSFRWFEIEPTEGLIAHAMYRVPFDKKSLLSLTPEPWPGTSDRLARFSQWLSRRSFRSALDKPIVNDFVKPMRKALDALKKKDRSLYYAFNEQVAEMRLVLPPSNDPPLTLSLVFLLDAEGLSAEAATALDWINNELRTSLDPTRAILGQTTNLTRSRMSVEFYFDTALIELEAISYDGDDPVGGLPLPPP
jgi:hypothetical protein